MQERLKEVGSIPGSGRSPGGGHGNPLQYSCLGNLMDKGAWRATVNRLHRVGRDWSNSSGKQAHWNSGGKPARPPAAVERLSRLRYPFFLPEAPWELQLIMAPCESRTPRKTKGRSLGEKRVSNFSGNLPSAKTEGPLCMEAHGEPKKDTEVRKKADWDLEQLTGRKFPFKKHKILNLPAGTGRSSA